MPVGSVTRRSFIDSALRAGAGMSMLGGSAIAALADSSSLIVHSARPQDLETPVHLLTTWITPNDAFYIRSHFYTPAIDAQTWQLPVDGDVARPLALTLDAIRRMPSRDVPVTLECAGNGRGNYDPPVAGVQWRRGAVGNARWTGVPLADVLRKAGLEPSAKFIWFAGADAGLGRAPDFVRSVPIDKVLHGDVLLAYEMNGEPLPLAHGFPLRVIVPGWEGAYCVKWVNHITASDHDHPGPFVSASYRIPRRPVPPGSVVNAADTVPIRGLVVKSIITSPADGAALMPGQAATISGFAWSGEYAIRTVEVSIDGGRSWAFARLGDDHAPHAWRQFTLPWRPRDPGSRVLLSRATDVRGRRQPLAADWNPGGYLFNAVDSVRVNVGEELAASPSHHPSDPYAPIAAVTPQDEAAAELLKTRCTICHATDLIDAQRLDANGWQRELTKMTGWGAQLSPSERDLLIDYLIRR
ncbi:MAG: sulfite oxidase-like oxidoreductase [Acidobacteria bacterium]|nr:MAG: sulfite oxidase-like oxidoreductase [Acidobacteriota bacterium]